MKPIEKAFADFYDSLPKIKVQGITSAKTPGPFKSFAAGWNAKAKTDEKVDFSGVDNANDWVHAIIFGPGGLIDFERYELALYHGCDKSALKDHMDWVPQGRPGQYLCWAVHWALHCLCSEDHRHILEKLIAESKKEKKKA